MKPGKSGVTNLLGRGNAFAGDDDGVDGLDIPENLSFYRRLSRLTQEKLAEKAELAPTYISDIERGRENISVDALQRIAESLGVGLEDLFRSK